MYYCVKYKMQTLPVDIIVSILAQDNRLLGMAHYLSKSIAKKARPIQLIKLIRNDPTFLEIGMFALTGAPFGCCTKESPRSNRTYSCYSVCVPKSGFARHTIVSDNIYYNGHGGDIQCYDVGSTEPYVPPIRADLYITQRIYQRRGGDVSVKIDLDKFLYRVKTVADVVAIHAFLSMHILILGHDIPNFLCHIPRFEDPSLCAHPTILEQVGEWYRIVSLSLDK